MDCGLVLACSLTTVFTTIMSKDPQDLLTKGRFRVPEGFILAVHQDRILHGIGLGMTSALTHRLSIRDLLEQDLTVNSIPSVHQGHVLHGHGLELIIGHAQCSFIAYGYH